jgi:polyphosphate kinase
MLRALLTSALLVPAAATAHPHLFFESGLTFVIDGDFRLTEVAVTWTYDPYYTLLVFEDLGLDPDGDLQLTDDEMARLRAADSDWPEDYEGDVYGTADGAPLALLPATGFDLRLDGDRIVSSHVRRLETPIDLRLARVGF